MLDKTIKEYATKAFSLENRKEWDGSSCAKYRVELNIAEYGRMYNSREGFEMEVEIPRRVDNDLGLSIFQKIEDREEAASVLRELADMIEEKGCTNK